MPDSSSKESRPRVRFLLPVWGTRYIERLCDLTLPALLAAGNLPALADRTDLEINILTTSESAHQIIDSAAYKEMARFAPVRVLFIDHLVVPMCQGVTLTYAYHFGVLQAGREAINIHFVFLNADIILADGSLAALAERIARGENAILANSIRANAEDLTPNLRELRTDDGRLQISPRELVRQALDAMHPTQVAKIVNDDLCHSVHVNQFYWRVDKNTLLSRHFLMFMLCLKPTRVVERIEGFCDYVFVNEFCGDMPTTAFEDSDEFFALELQARDSENSYLRLGAMQFADTVRSLSQWVNAHHRYVAQAHTLVFHSAALPDDTERIRQEAAEFVECVIRNLPPEPQPLRGHPYWVGAHDAWERGRTQKDSPSQIADGSPATADSTLTLATLKAHLMRRAVGSVPHVGFCSLYWADFRHFNRIVREAGETKRHRILHVHPDVRLYNPLPNATRTMTLSKFLSTSPELERFSAVFLESSPNDLQILAAALHTAIRVSSPEALTCVFLRSDQFCTDPTDVSAALREHLYTFTPFASRGISLHCAGGAFKRVMHSCAFLCEELLGHTARWQRGLGYLIRGTMLLVQMIYNLTVRGRRDCGQVPSWCSSMLIVIGPPIDTNRKLVDACSAGTEERK